MGPISCFKTLLFPVVLLWNFSDTCYCWSSWWSILVKPKEQSWSLWCFLSINLLNAKLNPICHLLALLGAHHILHVSRIRVKHNICKKPTVVSAHSLQLMSGLTIVSIPCNSAGSRIRLTENLVRNSCALTGSGRNRESTVTRAAISLSRSALWGRRWSSSHSDTLRRTL